MEIIIQSVRQAVLNKNWFASLFICLTLPDICGAMENPISRNGERYKKWYQKYLAGKYNHLSADDCWKLRNACLHECSDSDAQMAFKRVHFVEPQESMVIHNNILNDVLQLQIDVFCNDFCDAVEKWLVDMENMQEVIDRIKNLMRIHPITSLAPFIIFNK
ncbi:hypothetical protein [Legionella longbeachae]|uniref:hypothetical protein n=1 Tax=Legionella longbeachae TaxID=450 RepID=UPI001C18EB94|nr:hypothetical protein [Legionella pneumophila]